MDSFTNRNGLSNGGDSVKAPFVASLIRTGHLDNPVWRAIRYALHKWVRGISPLNRALDLLQGEGYTRMMAVAIATEFDKQCRNRTQFASKTDDNSTYEITDRNAVANTAIIRYPASWQPVPVHPADDAGRMDSPAGHSEMASPESASDGSIGNEGE
jgi:hypothetical protein